MSGDKLNTAEYDSKGRCIRHPDIRLRKKKIFGGWKILIGHCPECCLDEMRRVRDEIDGGEKKKKKDKKKHGKKSKKLERKGSDERSKDGFSMTSEGCDHNVAQGRHHGSGRRLREDGESEATGSTAQMSGGGSVVSEQYYREGGAMSPGHGHQHHYSSDNVRGYHQPHHAQPMYQQPSMMGHQERTMVLSMAFIDPQTGQRGTYTGQVNSINHKPDGKGTVYYNNGTIAEGSWSNGILSSDGSEEERSQASYERSRSRSYSRSRTREASRSASRNRAPEQEAGFGNLHLLNGLPGSKSRPRGASASVQSYNSRNSHGQPSGSASVQMGYSGEGGIYGGGVSHYAPPPPRRARHSVNSPPMMNKRGEYEP